MGRQGSFRDRLHRMIRVMDAGCWQWTGYLMPNGYAKINREGVVVLVHRAAYAEYVGPIPEGMWIDHLCRNRGCANPAHLEAVPPAENSHRGEHPNMVAHRTDTCGRGHSLIGARVEVRGKYRTRRCGECRRITNARRSA